MTQVNGFFFATDREDKTRCLQIPFRGHKNVGKLSAWTYTEGTNIPI